MRHQIFTAIFAVTASAAGLAQARLVVDINPTVLGNASSFPKHYLANGTSVWFVATTFPTGEELWHVDANGTTSLAVDLNPGQPGAQPRGLSPFGAGGVVFVADAGSGPALYRLDTPGQTPVQLTPTTPAIGFDINFEAIDAGSNLFFLADDGASGLELWVSGGATGDATLVLDIAPGSARSEISSFAVLGNRIVFVANDGQHGFEWWVSDGTTAGTRMIADLNPGPAQGAFFGRPLVIGNRAFLTADDGATGAELWSTDGNSLQLFANIAPGVLPSFASQFAPLGGGRFVFGANDDGSRGFELWISDGTVAGTNLLFEVNPGPESGFPRLLTAVSGGVFYCVTDTSAGEELCFTDGTAAGTRVLDLTPGNRSTFFLDPVAAGGRMYFGYSTRNDGRSRSLHVSDGTAAGTREVYATSPGDFAPFAGGSAVFRGDSMNEGVEPWVTDGTVAGTQLLVDLDTQNRTDDSQAVPLANFGGRTFLSADDGSGFAVWTTDGTAAGTTRIVASRITTEMLRLPHALLFGTANGLVSSDGTIAGTQILPVVARPANPARWADAAGALLDPEHVVFCGENPTTQQAELWITDGTAAGSTRIAAIPASDFIADGVGLVYFIGPRSGGSTDPTIWRTDGTAAGTTPFFTGIPPALRDIELIDAPSGRVLFNAFTSAGRELLIADGSASGTQALIQYTFDFSLLGPPVRLGGRLLFPTSEGVYTTDGSVSGTAMLVRSGSIGCRVSTVGNRGLIYYFNALWTTDGTVAGTVNLPVNFRLPSAGDARLVRMDPVSATRTVIGPDNSGAGLLITDGTTQGTGILTPSAWFAAWQATNGRVLFADRTQYFGVELYAVDLGAVAQPEGRGCGVSIPTLRLTSNEPVLGQTLLLQAPSPFPASAMLFGAPAPTPTPLPGAGCVLWVNPSQSPIAIPTIGGNLSTQLPTNASLVGARVMTQALAGPSAAPLGVEISNALLLVLDR